MMILRVKFIFSLEVQLDRRSQSNARKINFPDPTTRNKKSETTVGISASTRTFVCVAYFFKFCFWIFEKNTF